MKHTESTTTIIHHAAESLRNRKTVPLLDLGTVVLTSGVREHLDADVAAALLSAQSSADWGNGLPESDVLVNEHSDNVNRKALKGPDGEAVIGPADHPFEVWSLTESGRLFSVWNLPTVSEPVWVITENGQDGVTTTILLANEY
jgi:hypothetical protein